jgi:hypothetical protein
VKPGRMEPPTRALGRFRPQPQDRNRARGDRQRDHHARGAGAVLPFGGKHLVKLAAGEPFAQPGIRRAPVALRQPAGRSKAT